MSLRSLAYAYSPSTVDPVLQRIGTSDVGSRLAWGMFWTMAGSVISRGLMLCATILVARMLGKTGYGELGMIQSTVGMFGVVAGFGLGLTATKHVAELRQNDPERAGRIIGLSGLFAAVSGGLIALGFVIFAPWLAEHTINAPHLTDVLRIGALMLFLNAVNGAQTGALSGFEAFKTIAYVNLFVGLISFPLLVGGAYFGGLTGAVWALAINLGANWLLNHLALRREAKKHGVPLTIRNSRREWPILTTFSLPAALSGIMVAPADWLCRAMLANEPGGYNELGIFAAAMIFQMPLIFIAGMMGKPLLSMISNAGANISSKLSVLNILASWIIGVIAAIPLLCFPEIVQATLGEQYATYSFRASLSFLVLASTFMACKWGATRVLTARNMIWWVFYEQAVWAAALIVSALFLARWGAVGLAASFTLASVVSLLAILPVYYDRDIVPKGTFVSLNSILIWATLTTLLLLNIFDAGLLFRIVAFIPSLLVVGFAFARIIHGMNNQTDYGECPNYGTHSQSRVKQ